jgi:hypothetical protein
VEELRSFKRELDIIKEDKESQEKEAIQRAAALRTELQVSSNTNKERKKLNINYLELRKATY